MSKELTSNEKIHEALELLNQVAKDKRGELQHLMADKYDSVKDAINDQKKWAKAQGSSVIEAAREAERMAKEKARRAARAIDGSVHESPWPYIGSAVVCGLFVGLFINRPR